VDQTQVEVKKACASTPQPEGRQSGCVCKGDQKPLPKAKFSDRYESKRSPFKKAGGEIPVAEPLEKSKYRLGGAMSGSRKNFATRKPLQKGGE